MVNVVLIAGTDIYVVQLEPHVNGPFTPDLAHPISKLGQTAKSKGWPMDIAVGMSVHEVIGFNYHS